MAMWVIQTYPPDSEHRQAIDTIAALNGPVTDVETTFTNLDLGQGAFQTLTQGQRGQLTDRIRRCLTDYFTDICVRRPEAPLYAALADTIERGDTVITFNYDVSLENELISATKFTITNGYGRGFQVDWDGPGSDVIVLKLHGSINWAALVLQGLRGFGVPPNNSIGNHPLINNLASLLPAYPNRILDNAFTRSGIADSASLILPTYEKRYLVSTSLGDKWVYFYESLWSQAADALQESDRIVIVGYSMPEADRRSRALLLWNNNKKSEIHLCCANSNDSMKRAFEDHGFWRIMNRGKFSDLF
jgi:hypothetical protein